MGCLVGALLCGLVPALIVWSFVEGSTGCDLYYKPNNIIPPPEYCGWISISERFLVCWGLSALFFFLIGALMESYFSLAERADAKRRTYCPACQMLILKSNLKLHRYYCKRCDICVESSQLHDCAAYQREQERQRKQRERDAAQRAQERAQEWRKPDWMRMGMHPPGCSCPYCNTI